jgi:opacity protein-like surface antigen
MKHSILLSMAVLPLTVFSQNFHANVFAGVATYQGDLQGKRLTFNQSHPAIGIGISYDITDKFIARTGFTYGTLEGNDTKNTTAKGIEFRNLSFKSAVSELHVGVEYNLFRLEGKSITPYFFAGIAGFHINPYTNDSTGAKVFLRPLSTEGQGLAAYPDRKNYSLTQFAVPFGGGIKLQISDNLQLAAEVGIRKLFTDYLDDVSTNYVDFATLLAAKGEQAVALAYRGDELAGAPAYPAEGAQRGSPKTKDWYYFSGLRLSARLNNKASRIANGRSKLGCPTKVF